MKFTTDEIAVFFDSEMAEVATKETITITSSLPSLAIGTTKTKVANGAFVYRIGANVYSKVAVPVGTSASLAHEISADKWGVILYFIDSSGVITTDVPLATQAYDSAALATAAGDGVTLPADKCYIGRVLIQATGSGFIANTTNLDATTSTTYTDEDVSVTEVETVSFYVIFDNAQKVTDIQTGSLVMTAPQAICRTSDVSALKQGDEITIDSVVYKTIGIENDNGGFTTLILSKDYYREI